MSRPLRPHVITVFDNPIAQVRCEPDRDEIDVNALINEILVRFEFGIGTSFDLQFLTMDGTHLLAFRRFIVSKVVESLTTTNMNFGQTMTRTTNNRACQPISEWFIFDKVANILRDGKSKDDEEDDAADFDIENASPSFLQEFIKSKRGKGFRPGTSHAAMVEEAKKYL